MKRMNVNREELESLICRVLNINPNEEKSDWLNQSVDSFTLVKAVVVIEEEYDLELNLELFATESVITIDIFITIVLNYLLSI